MPTKIDAEFSALRGLGFTGSLTDMEGQWLRANGATSKHLGDAWFQFLISKGYTTGTRMDRMLAWLKGLGITKNTVMDALLEYWSNYANYSHLLTLLIGGPTSGQIAAGALLTDQGATVSCARALAAYCRKADGTLTLLGVNTPRVEPTGLLVETAATNICLRSKTFTNAAWTSQAGSAVTDNTAVAPDGTLTAATLTTNSVPGTAKGLYQLSISTTAVPTTFSIYVKAGTRSFFGMTIGNTKSCVVNLGTGVVSNPVLCTAVTEALGNGWYRVNLTCTPGVGDFLAFCIGDTAPHTDPNGGGAPFYTDAGGGTAFIWQAQTETGTLASSPIPTTSAAVTRPADVISITGLSTSKTAAKVTVKATPKSAWSGVTAELAAWSASANDNNALRARTASGVATASAHNSAGTATNATAGTASGSGTHTFIAHFGGTNVTATLDGVDGTPVALTGSKTASGANLYLGATRTGSSGFSGWLSDITLDGS